MTGLIDRTRYRADIISLWKHSFGDSDDYIKFFLDNCPSECIGHFINEKPVSMLFLLNGSVNGHKVKYIYAACTLEEFRGRGLMRELLEYCKIYCSELSCDGIFLVPAEESLYGYYERFGYISCFGRTDINTGFYAEADYELTELNDTGTIVSLRKKLLSGLDCFIFDDAVSAYAVNEHFYCGGRIFSDSKENGKCLIFASENGTKIEIKELIPAFDVKMLKNIKHLLNNDAENVYIRCPIVYNNTDNMGKTAKCGMCLPLTDEFERSLVGKCFYAGMYLD